MEVVAASNAAELLSSISQEAWLDHSAGAVAGLQDLERVARGHPRSLSNGYEFVRAEKCGYGQCRDEVTDKRFRDCKSARRWTCATTPRTKHEPTMPTPITPIFP
jgi:hypothetical protein